MGKKTIPFKVVNSFFYAKESTEPLPFLVSAPSETGSRTKSTESFIPKDHSDFLKKLEKSVKNLQSR